jgi:peroxiredoxin
VSVTDRTTRLQVGDLVPEVELVDHDGNTWRPSDHHGRPLVLVLHRHLA